MKTYGIAFTIGFILGFLTFCFQDGQFSLFTGLFAALCWGVAAVLLVHMRDMS